MLLQSKPELVLWPDRDRVHDIMPLVWVTPDVGEIVIQEPGAGAWWCLVEISVLVMTI